MFGGDGREYGVGNQVAGSVGLLASPSQQRQVSGAGTRRQVVGPGDDGVDKGERVGPR